MTSSTSSSSRCALALALSLLVGGCAHRPSGPADAERAREPRLARGARVVVLPIENLSGGSIPVQDVTAAITRALPPAGLQPILQDSVDALLARHRVRWTGGIDGRLGRAAREELQAEAVLVASVEGYREAPPRVSITMRLIATGEHPRILWMDAVARTGDDAPGLLGLGVIADVRRLLDDVVKTLGSSIAAYLGGQRPGFASCPDHSWYRPKVAYRSSALDLSRAPTVAVLPFVNDTRRSGAGEVLALEFVRQMTNAATFRSIEPGVVRQTLLENRVVMEGGVTLDGATVLLSAVDADLLLGGTVFEFDDSAATPRVDFTVFLLDRRTSRVVWNSSSRATGDEGVWFFGTGQVSTATGLTCGLARAAVDDMRTRRARAPPAGPARGADTAR